MLTVSTSGRVEAEHIARTLVEARLAACVQMLPIGSVYRWHGKLEVADEVLLIIKTSAARAAEAMAAIKAAHSYEVPEILMFRAKDGWPAYLAWVAAETSAG